MQLSTKAARKRKGLEHDLTVMRCPYAVHVRGVLPRPAYFPSQFHI